MELKEYLKIFKENIKLFIITVLVIILSSFAYFALKSVSYSASLTLNITRSGVQQTNDYRYDDFYRLQADEKFAETVVEWLNSPRTVTDVYAKAGISSVSLSMRQLGKIFVPEKLSAQIVSVSFSAKDEQSAKKISEAIAEVIKQNTDSLNENQNEDTWFAVVAQNPVIIQDNVGALIILLASLAMGIFIGFWVVMLRQYLR
jgi:capsular polysaccharide biosynthesis protein